MVCRQFEISDGWNATVHNSKNIWDIKLEVTVIFVCPVVNWD